MALTAGAKGIIVVGILGAVAYGVTQYRNSAKTTSSDSDSTSAKVDSVRIIDTNGTNVPQVIHINESTSVREEAPIVKHEQIKKEVKQKQHKSAGPVKRSEETHSETKANNVIPNF